MSVVPLYRTTVARVLVSHAGVSHACVDISPEGDKSDNRSYQVPADIADNKFTDNTTLGVTPLPQTAVD